jgi:hypothetical protein
MIWLSIQAAVSPLDPEVEEQQVVGQPVLSDL